MKVILLEDVEDLGTAGEIVEVSDGFARNALFSRGRAATASEVQMREAEAAKARAAREAEVELAQTQRLVEAVDGKTVTLTAPLGPQGKLHNAITAADIAAALEKELKTALSKGTVRLPAPIGEPGETRVNLEFPHGLEAEVTVVVEGEKRPAAETEETA